MANLTGSAVWSDVTQLETSTLALGGASGPMNEQAQSLLNRTEYLALFASRNNTYTKAQRGAYVALVSAAASIAVDLSLSNNFSHTLTEDTELAAPSNVVAGQAGVIHFTQDAATPRTLTFDSFWKFAGGSAPSLTASVDAVDVLSYVVDPSGTFATCTMLGNVS